MAIPTPQLSRSTLEFCAWLLGQVSLSASAEDFDEQAAHIGQAKREIAAALAAVIPQTIGTTAT